MAVFMARYRLIRLVARVGPSAGWELPGRVQ
jgi:hypothetical protein